MRIAATRVVGRVTRSAGAQRIVRISVRLLGVRTIVTISASIDDVFVSAGKMA